MALATLTALLLATAGVGAGALIFGEPTPSSLRAERPPTTVPVSAREFDDARTVEVAFSIGTPTRISAPAPGLVTRFACEAGGTLVSGRSDLSIDGRPILNLSTSMPLWRDLSWGTTGADVLALHQELARLGFPVAADSDRVEESTFVAMEELLASIGVNEEEDWTITAESLLWLPSAESAVQTCDASVGAPVTSGEEIATMPGALTSATISHIPQDTSPGDRILAIDDQTIPIDRNNGIAAENLAEVSASRAFAEAVRNKASTFTASWALESPLPAFVVPPSSLYGLDGRRGCVLGRAPLAVTVIGSELGQSFVAFDGEEVPAEVVISPDPASPSCG